MYLNNNFDKYLFLNLHKKYLYVISYLQCDSFIWKKLYCRNRSSYEKILAIPYIPNIKIHTSTHGLTSHVKLVIYVTIEKRSISNRIGCCSVPTSIAI